MEEKMENAHLINRYVYTIDSVSRLHDAQVYRARMEKKRVADSTNIANEAVLMEKWLNRKLKKK